MQTVIYRVSLQLTTLIWDHTHWIEPDLHLLYKKVSIYIRKMNWSYPISSITGFLHYQSPQFVRVCLIHINNQFLQTIHSWCDWYCTISFWNRVGCSRKLLLKIGKVVHSFIVGCSPILIYIPASKYCPHFRTHKYKSRKSLWNQVQDLFLHFLCTICYQKT